MQTPPTVTVQPDPYVYVCSRSNTTLFSSAIALPQAAIQWQVSGNGINNWTNVTNGTITSGILADFVINGATENQLELSVPNLNNQTFYFRAQFTNSCGTTYSNTSQFQVSKGPFINTDITQSVVCSGGWVTITAKITGAGAGNKDENKNKADLQFLNGSVWENVPGSHQESDNSGTIDYSFAIWTGNYPPNPEFRIFVTGKCGTVNTSIKILYIQSVVTTFNSCVGGPAVQFLLDGAITSSPLNAGEGWVVTGGGSINPVTGLFTPTTPGLYTATYKKGDCIDTKPFVVFPAAPSPVLGGGCGASLSIPAPAPVNGFSAEYSVQSPSGSVTSFVNLASANAFLANTYGCWTIKTRYVLTSDYTYGFITIPAGTVSPCGENTINAFVFPPKPVLTAPANTCSSAFTLPLVPAYAGFSVEWSIDGAAFAASPVIPVTPGCHTLKARYVVAAACGAVPAGASGGVDCESDPVDVVIFPAPPSTPTVSAGCGDFTVVAPALVSGFDVEYSFDDGDHWATSNASPSADDCTGYDVRTRYVLAADCGNTLKGTPGPLPDCSQSPALNRKIDKTPPNLVCPATIAPICIAQGSKYRNTGTGWDAVVSDNCTVSSVTAALSGATNLTGLTTLNAVDFNIGVTTVTWTASDGCNTVSCSFDVTINPIPDCSITGSASVCAGTSNTYTSVVNPAGGTVTHAWIISGDGTINGQADQATVDVVAAQVCASSSFILTDHISRDGCTSVCTYTVTVTPPDLPVFAAPPGNITVDCGAVPAPSSLTYTNGGSGACLIDGSVVSTQSADPGPCGGTITETWAAADNCGRQLAPVSRTITVRPAPLPAMTAPGDITLICENLTTAPGKLTYTNGLAGTCEITGESDLSTYSSVPTTWGEIITETWTATDPCGRNLQPVSRQITVIGGDPPAIDCPSDVTVLAEPLKNYRSGVIVNPPTITAGCVNPLLKWSLVPPADFASNYSVTDLSGDGIYPSPKTFYLGQTTITYTLTDIDGNELKDALGNVISCSFKVIVQSQPDITCPGNINVNADQGQCDALLDPGVPTLVNGGQPITWTWTMFYPDAGTQIATGGSTTTDAQPVPESIVPADPHKYPFKVGTTTIVWSATNDAGSDQCSQTITVTDNQKPSFTAPGPFEVCVENIQQAVYNGSGNVDINLDYIPDYPEVYPAGGDYYLFRAGSTLLDIDPTLINYTDNCCTDASNYSVRWEIDFDGTEPPVSGTGQPSAYIDPVTGQPADIKLWGDGVTFLTRVHTIKYWITDCHGNESLPFSTTITIKPRPNIIKQN